MTENATERHQARELLRRALAQPDAEFRDGQWEAIDALANQRKKLLVVQRTGWGKSSVYFIATRILRDLLLMSKQSRGNDCVMISRPFPMERAQ